jgi:N,N-dimethylformamidase
MITRAAAPRCILNLRVLEDMDIQAYFEDWSLKPGETARMAISTAHPSVRATLVRLLSGPRAAPAIEGRTADLGNVLDATLPGRLQTTAVGSYALLPLPAPLAGEPASIHCWIWPTVPERAAPQAVWSLGDATLVVREGGIELRAKDAPLVAIEAGVLGKHWYSVSVTLDGEQASIDLTRLDGKVDALQSASRQCAVTLSGNTLTLAAAGALETGSPALPFNGKIDSPTVEIRPGLCRREGVACFHRSSRPHCQWWRARHNRAQLGRYERFFPRKARSILRAAVP